MFLPKAGHEGDGEVKESGSSKPGNRFLRTDAAATGWRTGAEAGAQRSRPHWGLGAWTRVRLGSEIDTAGTQRLGRGQLVAGLC